MVNILIVDDHAVLRMGLKLLLDTQEDLKVVAQAGSGKEAMDILQKNKDIDFIILDLSLPDISGIDLMKKIKTCEMDVKILVLTMHTEFQYMKEVMLSGADGYLTKDTLDMELFTAIRQIEKGKRYLTKNSAMELVNSLIEEPIEKNYLSKREEEVLIFIAKGYPLTKIAHMLNLSVKTISTYKQRIMTKINCTENEELVEYARKQNLV